MSLLQADAVNLERVPVLDVIFAETTGVCGISSKIGSFNRKGQGYFGENTKLRQQGSDRHKSHPRDGCGVSSSVDLRKRM